MTEAEERLADDVSVLSPGGMVVVYADDIRSVLAECERLRVENDRLREAVCGKCGRSLAPDGDCYGCEVDRLKTMAWSTSVPTVDGWYLVFYELPERGLEYRESILTGGAVRHGVLYAWASARAAASTAYYGPIPRFHLNDNKEDRA